MYVKSLVGRAAGSIINLPKISADAAILNGTHEIATEKEIMNAGYKVSPIQSDAAAAELPEGYKVVRYPGGGGFELRNIDDTPAADQLFPNMLAAYEYAAALNAPTVIEEEKPKKSKTKSELAAEAKAAEEASAAELKAKEAADKLAAEEAAKNK